MRGIRLRAVVLLALLASLGGLQAGHDAAKRSPGRIPVSALSPDAVRAADLGLHAAAASLAWLKTIQNIAPFSIAQSPIVENLELVTGIDPSFSYPYAFAALVLPAAERPDAAVAIAERGLEAAPNDWRIPYYLGTIIHIHQGDRVRAATLLDRAARTPGAPPGLRVASARYGATSDNREAMRGLWLGIAENADDEETREQALAYLAHYAIRDEIDAAMAAFEQRFGRKPASWEELASSGHVPDGLRDPFGFRYDIDADGVLTISPE